MGHLTDGQCVMRIVVRTLPPCPVEPLPSLAVIGDPPLPPFPPPSGLGPRATVRAVRYAAAADLRRTDHPDCFIVRLHARHAAAARPLRGGG